MSETWQSGIRFADISDVGMRRANNQDSFASLPADSEERFTARGHLFVVADGMGAHAAGELASRMAIERIAMQYFRSAQGDATEALRDAVRDANAEIHRRGRQNPEFHNMGTTASSLAILPEGAVIAHVGDSRVYRLRNGTLEQLTFDHSLVWEMQASGQVHPDSVLGQSIPKNVITRSLGPNAEVAVDVEGPFEIRPGDAFLLCSDGLTGQVDDAEIGALVDCLPEDQATRVLVDLANLRGGPDNTTVIIVRVQGHRPAARPRRSDGQPPAVSPLLLAAVAACVLGAIVLAVANQPKTMVIAIMLAIVAAATAAFQYQTNRKPRRIGDAGPRRGGRAPYRRYDAAATAELTERLRGTVDALREAAQNKHWDIDWAGIDDLQRKAAQSLEDQAPKEAVRFQSEAIIETMKQLREQHNRMAGETAIDH